MKLLAHAAAAAADPSQQAIHREQHACMETVRKGGAGARLLVCEGVANPAQVPFAENAHDALRAVDGLGALEAPSEVGVALVKQRRRLRGGGRSVKPSGGKKRTQGLAS